MRAFIQKLPRRLKRDSRTGTCPFLSYPEPEDRTFARGQLTRVTVRTDTWEVLSVLTGLANSHRQAP